MTQIILNEELTRMEKENKELKKYEEIKNKYSKKRKYDKEKWDNFVENCFNWKEEVNYKRKAAEILRNKIDKKNRQPKINLNSKKIMKKRQKGNNSFDDVFSRLYKAHEEHKERQQILKEKNLPSFAPKINSYVNKKKNNHFKLIIVL